MEFKKVGHYLKRMKHLGVRASVVLMKSRLQNRVFTYYWRTKALSNSASYNWKTIAKKLPYSLRKFFHFWAHQRLHFQLPLEKLYLAIPDSELLVQAQEFKNNIFSILGSSKRRYDQIPWHQDIRLQEYNDKADSSYGLHYYKEIVITPGNEEFVKDIKVPWELSRLQHIFVLGYAYKQTQDEEYVIAIMNQMTDWQRNNPFLRGANWVCPMDVALRAVNILWALELIKESSSLTPEFLQMLTTSLYDHFYYLENNWELYDYKTSNHYLSDLIGYFYLCYFFKDLQGVEQKTNWCYQEILREFDKQVFCDGSDYEGSTAYHTLITELFYHFFLIAPQMGFVLHEECNQKLKRMFDFIAWLTPNGSSLIKIGDDDSGKVLYYKLSEKLIASMVLQQQKEVKHFKDFGLSIVKTPKIHYSLRHAVFNNRQPSGHFHNDQVSLTLTYNGIDIFVDPGSYVYTPSAMWRNKFRSVTMHNSFYIQEREPVVFDERLFNLALPESTFNEDWIDKNNDLKLMTSHDLYKDFYGLKAFRTIWYEPSDTVFHIHDMWQSEYSCEALSLRGNWNFTLNPAIVPYQTAQGIMLQHEGVDIALFSSSLRFQIQPTWVSYHYGTKMRSLALQASINIMRNDPLMTMLTFF